MRRGIRPHWVAVVLGSGISMLAASSALLSQPLPDRDVEFARDAFFVKLSEAATQTVAVSKTAETGRTGISSIDQLNEAAGVRRIVPVFRPGGKFEARHKAYGLDRWYRFLTDGTVDIGEAVERYRADPNILAAEFQPVPALDVMPDARPTVSVYGPSDARLEANDTLFADQWNFDNTGQADGTVDADIDLPEAWAIGTGDPSVIVAVLDTGIDPNHPDLEPNVWHNVGEIPDNGLDDDDNGYVDDTWGWDYFNNDNDPTYGEPHGTHTSGTVVAKTNNQTGVAGIAGGWGSDQAGARVMVLAAHWGYPEAIVYAADNGATIASYSWSGTTFTFEIVEEVFRYFVETAEGPDGSMPGGLIIFSAGNEGTTTWEYPKAYSEVIAVEATDRNDEVPSWSNRGEWVDLAAPGVSVLSTYIHGMYWVYSGTSMSAPHVAGVAALVRSARPDLPAAAVRYVLEQSADEISQPDLRTGRLNARRALELATGDLPAVHPQPPDLNFRTVTLGKQRTMTVTLWNIASDDHTVSLSSDNQRFRPSESQLVVPGGDKASFDVVFEPTRKELETGALTVQDGGTTIELPLRGDAHEFTDFFVGMQEVAFPSLAWADYDRDGDPDLLLTGESGTVAFKDRWAIVYRNNGDESFSDANVGFNGVTNGSGTWADYDNDGDLDILLTGEANLIFDTRLLRNDGGGQFVETPADLPPLIESRAAWADFDNDGYKDVALMGAYPPYVNNPEHYLLLFRNNHGSGFEQYAALTGESSGDLAFEDYDLDGDADLVVCGWNRIDRSTILYRNDEGSFVDSGIALDAVKDCSVAWGDLDGDGDSDLVLTGESISGATSAIYRNDGSGTFTDIGHRGLAPTRVGSSTLGDYNNDGDLDVLLTGAMGDGFVVRFSGLWENFGESGFTKIESFVGIATSASAWADFDLDGDLDFVVAGQDDHNRYTRLYRNGGAPNPNVRPDPPRTLSASVDGGSASLSWSAGSDLETPSVSLTYEVRIGSIPGAGDIVSPAATDDGRRLVASSGSVGLRTGWTIRNLENGTYYWSVQSVDNGFSGSPFAPEATFTVTDSPIGSPNVDQVTLKSPADSAKGEPTSLSLSWKSLTEARFYQVQVSATPDFGALVADEVTVESVLSFIAPVADNRYYWRVRGIRGQVVGAWSEPRTFVIGTTGDYSAQLLFPVNGATMVSQPLTLSWAPAQKAVTYELQISSSPAFNLPEVVRSNLTDTRVTVSGLPAGTRLYWRVRGIGSNGQGTWTASRTFETLAKPDLVTLVEPLDGTVDLVQRPTFKWTAVGLTDFYHVQIDSVASFLDPVVDDSTLTDVSLTAETDLALGVTYSWRVRAMNAAGWGPWSDPWQFTVARGTAVNDDIPIPTAFEVYPVYPDPTSDRFTVSFDLPRPASVQIELFDVLGRHKAHLLHEDLAAKHYERTMRLERVASGLYLVRVMAGSSVKTVPLMIIRR